MLSTEKRYREKLSVAKRSLPCGTGLISGSRYSVRECSYSISRKGNWNSHWHGDQQRNVDRFSCKLASLQNRRSVWRLECSRAPTPLPHVSEARKRVMSPCTPDPSSALPIHMQPVSLPEQDSAVSTEQWAKGRAPSTRAGQEVFSLLLGVSPLAFFVVALELTPNQYFTNWYTNKYPLSILC